MSTAGALAVTSNSALAQTLQEFEQGSWYDDFRGTQAVHQRLTQLADKHEGAETFVVGQSHEGRDLLGIRLGKLGAPGVLVTGTQHAREWISPMVTMCLAELLTTSADEGVVRALERLDITVIPIVNPDGYEHSRSGARLWRKNRGNPGVDLNRNWGVGFGIGATTDPDSDSYPGGSAFSEPESRSVAEYMRANGNLRVFLDYHSDAQVVAHPLAYTSEPPANFDEIAELSREMAQIMSGVHGKQHGVVRTGSRGPAGGLAADYAVEEHGMLALTIELRRGPSAFVLPTNQIQPTCEENIPAFVAVTNHLIDQLPAVSDPPAMPEPMMPEPMMPEPPAAPTSEVPQAPPSGTASPGVGPSPRGPEMTEPPPQPSSPQQPQLPAVGEAPTPPGGAASPEVEPTPQVAPANASGAASLGGAAPAPPGQELEGADGCACGVVGGRPFADGLTGLALCWLSIAAGFVRLRRFECVVVRRAE